MWPSSIRSTRRAPTATPSSALGPSPLSRTPGPGRWLAPGGSETGGPSPQRIPHSKTGSVATWLMTARSTAPLAARAAPLRHALQRTSKFVWRCASALAPTCSTMDLVAWCAMTRLATTPLHSRYITRLATLFQSLHSRPIPHAPALTSLTNRPLTRSIARAAFTILVGPQAAAVTRATTPRWTLPGESPFSD